MIGIERGSSNERDGIGIDGREMGLDGEVLVREMGLVLMGE